MHQCVKFLLRFIVKEKEIRNINDFVQNYTLKQHFHVFLLIIEHLNFLLDLKRNILFFIRIILETLQ